MKVNEIFDSFQGEGIHIGVPATFLRLSGCNLNCDFCDTEHEDYKELSVELVKESILQHMKNNNTQLLVITGGEPLLQYDELRELVESLDCNIQIETNGSILRIPLKNTEYVISPKSKIQKVFEFYKDYDKSYFKFIISNGFDLHIVKELLGRYDYNKTVWLQPEFSKADEVTSLILSKHPSFKYRISGQLHKYLLKE